MAKRWSEEDDDLDVDLEFDRVEYMKKEINKGKSTLVAVAIAPIFAFVTMYVFTLTEVWEISLVTGMLGLIFLKPIYDRLDIDLDKIGKKGWIKNGGVYFLTLLAVWVILMNPPFADYAGPQVEEVRIEVYQDEDWVRIREAENLTEGESYDIRIHAEITDNVEVDDDKVEILSDDPDTEDFGIRSFEPMNKTNDHWYAYEISDWEYEPGSYSVTIRAEDVNENRNSISREIEVPEQ